MRALKILILIILTYYQLSSQVSYYSLSKSLKDYHEIEVAKDSITKYHVKSIKGVLYRRKYNTDAFKKEMTICEKKYDTTGNAIYEKLSWFCVDGYCSQIYKHSYTNGRLTESKECYSNGDDKQKIKYYYKPQDTTIITFSRYKYRMLAYNDYKKLSWVKDVDQNYPTERTTYDYMYNHKGQITRIDEVTKAENRKTTGVVVFYDYDHLGRKTEESINSDEFLKPKTIKYTYRYNSKNSQVLDVLLYNKNGELAYKKSFVYSGNKIVEINYYDDENLHYEKVKFTYTYYR
ncbi:MAG: hypothetical protein V4580_17045 [Bacteroidota bacterium]